MQKETCGGELAAQPQGRSGYIYICNWIIFASYGSLPGLICKKLLIKSNQCNLQMSFQSFDCKTSSARMQSKRLLWLPFCHRFWFASNLMKGPSVSASFWNHVAGKGCCVNNQGPNSSRIVQITAAPADATPKTARSKAKGRRHCDRIPKKKAGAWVEWISEWITFLICIKIAS